MKTTQPKQLAFHSELGITKSDVFKVNKPKTLDAEMQECFTKLKELVPSVPQNRKVSKVQILQHVIDYILDLEIALDTHPESHLVTATTIPRQPLVETSQNSCNSLILEKTCEGISASECSPRTVPC